MKLTQVEAALLARYREIAARYPAGAALLRNFAGDLACQLDTVVEQYLNDRVNELCEARNG